MTGGRCSWDGVCGGVGRHEGAEGVFRHGGRRRSKAEADSSGPADHLHFIGSLNNMLVLTAR